MKIKLTETEKRIIQLVSNNPEKLNTLRLTRKAKMSYTHGRKKVNDLISKGLIESIKYDNRENRLVLTKEGIENVILINEGEIKE